MEVTTTETFIEKATGKRTFNSFKYDKFCTREDFEKLGGDATEVYLENRNELADKRSLCTSQKSVFF